MRATAAIRAKRYGQYLVRKPNTMSIKSATGLAPLLTSVRQR
jgi:hypothetical protein